MHTRKKALFWIAFLAAVLSLSLAAAFINAQSRQKQWEQARLQAEVHIIQGDYESAAKELRPLIDALGKKRNSDLEYLLEYCYARIDYEKGDFEAAQRSMKHIYTFSDEASHWQQVTDHFSQRLDKEYTIWQQKQRELARERREERIRTGVPFVGMEETRIADTTLGSPDPQIRHNTEMINGRCHTANLYDFKVNGHTVFTARCLQGEVVQVWDNRDKVDTSKPYVPYVPAPRDKEKKQRSDPYDVYDYEDPEDFYFDHEDEFEDIEDAEDYFYEAWDE